MKMRENNSVNLYEIKIMPVKQNNGLVGFASAILNNQIYIGCIGIYTSLSSPDGFRLVYPTKLLSNGTNISIFHPITREAGLSIQKVIISEYLKLVEELTKGEI
jgi:DNA-binding cell septation regulator SpoVG